MILNLENFMTNLSFCLLFVTMLFYWIFTGFLKNSKSLQLGTLGMFFANLSLLIVLIIRWLESGHFPLSNLYESLLFLSWSLTFLHLSIELTNNNKSNNIDLSFIGTITAPSALLTSSFANFSLPIEMQKSSALVPALQSNWLIMHVTIMILSYAALILGCLLSITFLIVTRAQDINLTGNSFGNLSSSYDTNDKIILTVNTVNNLSTNCNKQTNKDITNLNSVILSQENNLLLINNISSSYNLAKSLDNLSYRILGLGFPLLTIGILSGSVWANEAWGSYWSWDPKETWAFLTWLVFAIYLHTRITKGWQGKKPALIASFGFIIVWVCFIGVNLLGKGLHSYGWVRLF
jgi:cytochrome c-type biogenesis protein CcsB